MNMEPDLLFSMQTRISDRTRPAKKYNRYEDDFVVDRIYLKKIEEELVCLEEIPASQYIDIVDGQDKEWIDDRSKPEVELDDEQKQLRNLRVLEWLNKMTQRKPVSRFRT